MMNLINIDGHKAVVKYDPEIDLFRGEFIGLKGGADFYANDIQGLKIEGKLSLQAYLDACNESGIEPYKAFSGKFNTRIDPQLHAAIVAASAAENKSLNQWVADTLSAAASN